MKLNLKVFLIFLVPIAIATNCIAESSSPVKSGFVSESASSNNRSSDAPSVNNEPEHWLIIRGHKEANLEVWFQITYATTISNCNTRGLFGVIGGAPPESQRINKMIRVPESETDFEVKMAVDHFLPGSCGWKANSLSVSSFLPSLNSGPIGWIGHAFIVPNGPASVTLVDKCQMRIDEYRNQTFPICMTAPQGRIEISENGGVIDLTFTLIPLKGKRQE
jgi:hypothetical protein